ncbi:helix-turn-helix domain-containing protein [Olsenella intestinalis]|uniref:helix-turn-helix domain-containing protein n=1 Tax=Olsenella intestinalis TaxID=2930083 RepID=UPI0020109F1F|nr:helix-turn-helix domain-containing protein [Olsenella intestinalis]
MKRADELFEPAGPQDVKPLVVDTETAAEMLSMAPGTLANMRYTKGPYNGPKFARIGKKIVYPVAELERYVTEHLVVM